MLNQTQKQIHSFLKEKSPSVAGLYWSAVNILFGKEHPLNSKVRLVCHLCREIGNRLPDTLAGQSIKKSFEYSVEVEKVAIIWNKENPFGQYDFSKGNSGSQESISVSLLLLREIEQLIHKHENVKGIREKRATALVQYLEPENKVNEHNTYVVVKQIKDLIGWFAGRAHESEKNNSITEDELMSKYQLLETTFYSLIGHYYAGLDDIRRIVTEANAMTLVPDDIKVQEAIAIMGKPKYRNYFFGNLKNPLWLEPLNKKGSFKDFPPVVKDGDSTIYYRWQQGDYLVAMAEKRPSEVLKIIKGIKTDNMRVVFPCLKALAAMPVDVATGGMELVRRVLKRKNINNDWYYIGEPAAQLMVKFTEGGKYDAAFVIAEKLLEVKIKRDKAFGANWYNLVGRFTDYHYGELLFQYVKVLWKKQGLRTGRMLIELLDNQIEKEQERINKRNLPEKVKKACEKTSEDQEEKPFDVTEHSYIIIPAVGKIDESMHDTAKAIVDGICRIAGHLMKTDEEGAYEFIRLLDAKGRIVFKRIEINMLRFSRGDTWKKEIEEILGNEDNYGNEWVQEEFKTLLNEKWDEISEPIREKYIAWAEGRTIDDEEKFKEWFKNAKGNIAEQKDIDAYNHYYKAQALYCIKDKDDIRGIYEDHRHKSKRTDDEIKPHTLGVAVDWIPGPDSPMAIEEMKAKSVKEVVEYILAYDQEHPDEEESGDETRNFWKRRSDLKEGLANEFRKDLLDRVGEYIGTEADLIVGMSERFVYSYFSVIDELLNTQKLERPGWGKILEVMQEFVLAKGLQKEYRSVSTLIPRVLERGFKNEKCLLPVDEKTLDVVWDILTMILEYPEKEDIKKDADIISSCMNCPPGQAFENIIRFGLFCKNRNEALFRERYSGKFRVLLQKVMDNIRLRKVKCIFALYFANLCWIDEKWTREIVNKILVQDKTMREGFMWSMYVGWTRPTLKGFEIAKEKYQRAVEMEEQIPYSDQDNYQKRLLNHIIRAYWQGWIGLEEDGMLRKLFGKMDDGMKGEAAEWIASGFESLEEDKEEKGEWKEGVVRRMGEYWEWRYGEMQGNPQGHSIEAQAFAGWVKDSPFKASKAFDIAEKSMVLSGGKVGRRLGMRKFFEGMSQIAEGQELRVLRLVEKAISNTGEDDEFTFYHDKLEPLMKSIVDMEDGRDDIHEIRMAAMRIADSFGRRRENCFKEVYYCLKEKEEQRKV